MWWIMQVMLNSTVLIAWILALIKQWVESLEDRPLQEDFDGDETDDYDDSRWRATGLRRL